MSNRFFETFGNPIDPASKGSKKATESLMREAIQTQIEIQQGKRPTNAKGMPIKPWFNESKLLFTPKFGTALLFGKKGAVKYKKGQEMDMLQLLDEMHEKGELDEYLKVFKEKRGI
jgi:hypothetical protein